MPKFDVPPWAKKYPPYWGVVAREVTWPFTPMEPPVKDPPMPDPTAGVDVPETATRLLASVEVFVASKTLAELLLPETLSSCACVTGEKRPTPATQPIKTPMCP